ncbi:YceI family protein [Polaromonas sp. P1(28)-8]|nr:YceI family protein [Polaromonas sp. P1(28)-8]
MIHSLLRLAVLTPALLLNAAHAGWEIDPSHTHVSFQVSHLGISNTPGIFRKVEGRVTYDDKNVEASSVAITIDAASIDTVDGARWRSAQRGLVRCGEEPEDQLCLNVGSSCR